MTTTLVKRLHCGLLPDAGRRTEEEPDEQQDGHCIGERASELVHIGQAIVALGGTVETFIEMVFNYPTFGEVYKYAAYDALSRVTPGPSPG